MTVSDVKPSAVEVELSGYGGAPVSMYTVFYDRNPDREIHIVTSPDRMYAYMKILPGPKFSGVTVAAVAGILMAAGVVRGLIEQGINHFIAQQSGPAPFDGYFQVARGEPMRKGEDGSIEFHVQPTSFRPRYDKDDAGNIDFKQLNLIENCFAGQRVASILPPGPGRAGINVFGEELPPVAGAPVQVRTGPGVSVASNDREFTAEIEGRLIYEDGVLTVSPILEIAHDVDYSVGNIDFVGKVLVQGSLLDGFYINAKQGVEISGEVGAARITSKGKVKIVGGIRGKNAAIIACHDLSAHYIDDAVIEASGDVEATKEILNSDVKSLGCVSIPDGAIVGGAVCGFKGVEAGVIGSEIGVATRVAAGLNWTEEIRKEEMRDKIAEYMDRILSSKMVLDPLFADDSVKTRLGSEQKSLLSELISELRALRENLLDVLQDRASLVSRRQDGMVDQINVRKMLYPGVKVNFSQVEGEVKDSAKGPLSIVQDVSGKSFKIGGHAKLPQLKEPAPNAADGNKAS
ncbi:MAG: FapA family protein [Planctomycetes bacterium]|nr:FapA family protein [Planctomycetota bacterium]